MKYVLNPEYIIKDIHFINDDLVRISYTFQEAFIPASINTNPALSAMVTSYGRLHLYESMAKLPYKVIYFDTDSIIAIESTDPQKQILKTGDSLGEL